MENDKVGRVLGELQRRVDGREIADVEEEVAKLVIFALMDGRYALYGSDVREITTCSEIAFVPDCPDFVMGVIGLHGNIESVVDLAGFLRLNRGGDERNDDAAAGHVVIVEKGGIRSGILVDSVCDVLDVPVRLITPVAVTADDSFRECVAAKTIHRDDQVILLDIGKIFEKIMGGAR